MLPQQLINVSGIPVATDAAGRFSLNDLHKAAGAETRHQPAQFLRLDSTTALTEAMAAEQGDMGNPISVTRGGPAQGTYVCRELVYAYAMWISAKFHLEVIRTFDSVAAGQAPAPAARVRRAAPVKSPIVLAAAMAPPLMRALRCFGIDKNAAAIGANQIINGQTGINLLALAGHTHLPTPTQEIYFTPTQIGSRRCVSAQAMNRAIADAGLQERVSGDWVPTIKGRPFALVVETGKAHSNGTPVQQVKWMDSVLSEVSL